MGTYWERMQALGNVGQSASDRDECQERAEVEDGLSFGLLPQSRSRHLSFVSSFAVQTAALAVLVNVALMTVPEIVAPQRALAVTQLISTSPVQRPAVRPPRALTTPATEPIAAPRIRMPALRQPIVAEAPTAPPIKFTSPSPQLPEVPKVAVRGVHTEVFASTGSQATPQLAQPARRVQIGGFGDPAGVPGAQSAGRANIAQVGSFDLPAGPGYGNGSGGAKGVRGTVASAGFGNSIATGPKATEASRPKQVASTTFASVQSAPPSVAAHSAPEATRTTPVKILAKPNPVYTAEARELRIEGEVLLQVTFTAGGQCQVKHVVRGLGHGLDEAAIRSAQQIRFRPASEDGRPVDSSATLHVIFQLT